MSETLFCSKWLLYGDPGVAPLGRSRNMGWDWASQFRRANRFAFFLLRRLRFLWSNFFTRKAPFCEILFCNENDYTRINRALRVFLAYLPKKSRFSIDEHEKDAFASAMLFKLVAEIREKEGNSSETASHYQSASILFEKAAVKFEERASEWQASQPVAQLIKLNKPGLVFNHIRK